MTGSDFADQITGDNAAILNGGLGIDTAAYSPSGAGVFISLYNDVAAGGDAEGDQLDSIENVTGSAYHDDLWATTVPTLYMATMATMSRRVLAAPTPC